MGSHEKIFNLVTFIQHLFLTLDTSCESCLTQKKLNSQESDLIASKLLFLLLLLPRLAQENNLQDQNEVFFFLSC